jgi:hypothetical protein
MKGIKASVMAEPQLAIWSVQTVPGQPTMLRMYAASRPDMTVIPRESGYQRAAAVGFIAAADTASPAFAGDAMRRQCDPSHIVCRTVARLSFVFRV